MARDTGLEWQEWDRRSGLKLAGILNGCREIIPLGSWDKPLVPGVSVGQVYTLLELGSSGGTDRRVPDPLA